MSLTCCVNIGPKKFIVLMSGDIIREAFIAKGHDFDGRFHFASGKSA